MAKIVVTGGEGFLGRNLVNQLVSEYQDVCATYNYTPPDNAERTRYLSHFRIDVTDFNQCAKLIMQEEPEILYHLVAQPIVTAAIRNPLLTFQLTTQGTWNMLEAVRLYGMHKIKAIVFVSSDKVYGDNLNADETSPLAGVDHPYNVAKVAADVIAQSYVKAYGLPIVISRSANLYGPGDFHWDRIVPGISRDILMNRSPIIRSNGHQLRDYIYIADGVKALIMMAEAMYAGRINAGSVFNFGSDESYTAVRIVHELLTAANRVDMMPIVQGGAKDEIPGQHINYSKAARILNWHPSTPLEWGLSVTFHWYKTWFSK